jgi:hypothetical protein
MRRDRLRSWASRGLALAIAAGLLAASARADIVAPGRRSIAHTVRIAWGPLEGRLARPATVSAGDTWETVASREAADVRWAPTIRAMNGGAEAPPAQAPVWVPPRGRAFDAAGVWYSAYVDASKFGPASDVSRTGFRRLDPGASATPVFGTVTVLLLPHAGADDAARSAAIPTRSAKEVFAARAAEGLVVAPSFEVEGTVPDASPVHRVETAWRCEGVAQGALRLVEAGVVRRRADGSEVSAAEAAVAGLATEWIAGAAAVVVLSVLALLLVRRWRRRERDGG